MAKLLASTNITITKTWFQQPNGFTYPIALRVPTIQSLANKEIPVAILLHGMGGSGESELNSWNSILPDHILVAPTGYLNSWNIATEDSKAPDVAMLQELVEKLKTYNNVDKTKIRIIGFSNGSALAQRAYVQLDETGIDQIVAIASTMGTFAYRDNQFFIPANESSTGPNTSNYPFPKNPFKPRKIITFHGQTDTTIPYNGGFHSFGYTFLSAQANAFALAKGQGYTGTQILDNVGSADIGGSFKYTYNTPNGDVIHYKYPEGHIVPASVKTLVSNNFSFVHQNQLDIPSPIPVLKWHANKLNTIDTTGTYPSVTEFTFDGQNIQASSDGDPFPALAGQENTNTGNRSFGVNTNFIKDQSYKFTFKNRAGENTANPQPSNLNGMGIFANGVLVSSPSAGDHALPGTNEFPPLGFNYNTSHLGIAYGIDSAGGYPELNGNYHYRNGNFLYNAWNTPKIFATNSYFNLTNFENDKFRHADGHSKIIGYCFDGYPIYGPYGYTIATDINTPVVQMTSSYKILPNDNHRPNNFKFDRTVDIDGVGTITLDAGSFIQDFEYKEGHGTLDRYNGRYTTTPDFPNGTYAYFLTFEKTTVDIGIESVKPSYPYILGEETKQNRNLLEDIDQNVLDAALSLNALWNVPTGTKITNLIERSVVDIKMPLANGVTPTLEVISGSLPNGTRIEGTSVVGTVYEVAYDTIFRATIRADHKGIWEDRTIEFAVSGPDDPVWNTPQGDLPVGPNSTFYILDSARINFQLNATDNDLPAGDTLTYFIAEGDGSLPPGISMSETGLLTGITDPLLSLDKRFEGGGYDADNYGYGSLPLDYATLSSNGFSSFFYDTNTYDYNEPTVNPRKLNRYYPFRVTVTDGESFVKREFTIYVVGDDFLKADNTQLTASSGVFKADNTNVRQPNWITPGNLGIRRAGNYQTIYLDVIDNPTLEGVMLFTVEDVNDDGTKSELPPGLLLDSRLGELVGAVPGQQEIVKDYKFTIKATRMTTDLESVDIVASYYEDTMLGKTSFKIFKLNLSGAVDGVNDLFELNGRDILLGNQLVKVTNVDDNNPDYDVIFIDQTINPTINLIPSRTATAGQSFVYVDRLSEFNKEKYMNRTIKFDETEKYKITDITPYIEYEITQESPSNDEIYPVGIPRNIEIGVNFFVGDMVINTTATGGDGKIYKCTTAHSVLSAGTVVNGITQINFQASNWTEIAETVAGMTLSDRVEATKQVLEAAYNGSATVRVMNDQATRWRIQIPSTATSRINSNIRGHFANAADSTAIKVTLLRDNEHRIGFDVNLSRQLTQGNNYGIGLFKGEGFSENIIVANTKDIPSTTKTFTIRLIGEIDSSIKWLTDANLGTLQANKICNLRIEAETTVPDTRMLYYIKAGKLPFGLSLGLDGEILGKARQFSTASGPGLTTFENKDVSWDGVLPGDTTFDRQYKFTVGAKDRFQYTEIEREFTLKIADPDTKKYTDIYMRPLLDSDERTLYANFISDRTIFNPEKIYRAEDPLYGIKTSLEMLVYAGIESKKIENFVAAAAKNHKRKKYILGDFKTAKATSGIGSTAQDIYEVVYIEVIDPANAKKGKTKTNFEITTGNKITVDSVQYSPKDDDGRFRSGYDALPVYTRGVTKFIFEEAEDVLIVQTRDSSDSSENQFVNTDNNDFEVTLNDSSTVLVTLELTDSEPLRLRPDTNTIKTDSNAVKVSQSNDNIRYISSVDNMRNNISQIGANDREYLPLWMRTPQAGLQELDYVTAIPICYCKPGQSADILRNIQNSGFDPKKINFDIDRYIVKSTEDVTKESYILFANYQFNV